MQDLHLTSITPQNKGLPSLEKGEESMHLNHGKRSGSCQNFLSPNYELNYYKAVKKVFHLNRNLQTTMRTFIKESLLQNIKYCIFNATYIQENISVACICCITPC